MFQRRSGLASAYELEGVGPRVLGVAGHDMHALEAAVRPDGDDEPTADTELLLERLRHMVLRAKDPRVESPLHLTRSCEHGWRMGRERGAGGGGGVGPAYG